MAIKARKEYFVYALANPITCKVFYIGKGINDRPKHHVKDCKRGVIINSKKHEEIVDCLCHGKEPKVIMLRSGLAEDVAYNLESDLIHRYTNRITNVLKRSRGGNTIQLAKSKDLLRKLIPFERWSVGRREEDHKWYFYVKSNLEKLILKMS